LDDVSKDGIAKGAGLTVLAIGEAADMIRDEIKAEAPVDEGKLVDAVYARMAAGGNVAEVGVDQSKGGAPHAHMVEYGTSQRATGSGASRGKMGRNPFFRRGLERSRNRAIEEIKQIVGKGVSKIWDSK